MKDNKLVLIGIYIVQYVVIYMIIFALNRVLGLEVSRDAFSISRFVTIFIMGVPLMFLLVKLENSMWVLLVLGILHVFIISTFLNIIMGS